MTTLRDKTVQEPTVQATVSWLLERPRNPEHAYDEIFLCIENGSIRWSVDAFKALRFARKEDAESAWDIFSWMRDSSDRPIQVIGRNASATEHVFYERDAQGIEELARRLSEAEQQIAEKDAALAQCALIGRNVFLALTPDLPKDKRPTFEEFSTAIQSLTATAKHDAEIIKAAEELVNTFNDPMTRSEATLYNAVRAKKGEKV